MKMASHPYSVGLFLAAHGGVGFMSICPQTVLEIRRRLGGNHSVLQEKYNE